MLSRTTLLAAVVLAFAIVPGAVANTIVRLDTSIGAMTFQLYDDAKPVTVANFLSYVTSGRYDQSFAHRLPQGFVLQGGAFTYDGTTIHGIPSFGPIVNEAGPFPQYSNVQGTLVMAKVDGDPNSATSSWFINLRDNNTGTALEGNLDLQNGGFTVFGSIVDGLDVLQAFQSFTNYTGSDGSDLIVNVGSPFDNLPVTRVSGGVFNPAYIVYTTWSVVPEPAPFTLLGIAGIGALGILRLRCFPRPARARFPGGSACR